MGLTRNTGRILIALLFVVVMPAQGALTLTDRGGSTDSASSASASCISSSTIAAGSFGILVIGFDNAGAAGSTKILNGATLTDNQGNTWTRRLDFIYDPAAASAGFEIGAYTSQLTSSFPSGSGNVPVTFSSATAAKLWRFYQVDCTAGNTVSYITGAAKCDGCTSGQTGTAVQITTGTMNVGDACIAFMGAEDTGTMTLDSDSSNGTWSAGSSFTVGSAGSSGGKMATQYKVQTTTSSTQSWDITLGTSSDWQAAWLQLREVAAPLTKSNFMFFFPKINP